MWPASVPPCAATRSGPTFRKCHAKADVIVRALLVRAASSASSRARRGSTAARRSARCRRRDETSRSASRSVDAQADAAGRDAHRRRERPHHRRPVLAASLTCPTAKRLTMKSPAVVPACLRPSGLKTSSRDRAIDRGAGHRFDDAAGHAEAGVVVAPRRARRWRDLHQVGHHRRDEIAQRVLAALGAGDLALPSGAYASAGSRP